MVIENQLLSPIEFFKALWEWKQGLINSLWFLGTLVCIYIFFPLLKNVYDTNKKVFFYFIVISLVLTFGNRLLNQGTLIFLNNIVHVKAKIENFNFFNMFNPYRNIYGYAIVYFCIGGYIYKYKDKILAIPTKKRNLIAIVSIIINCLLLFVIGLCLSDIYSEKYDIVWFGYDTIFTFINVISLYVLSLNLTKDYKLIKIISCNTLGIYFIHEIFIHLTQKHVQLVSYLCNIPGNILYGIIILGLSLITTLIIKKIPI